MSGGDENRSHAGKGAAPKGRTQASVHQTEYDVRTPRGEQSELSGQDVTVDEGTRLVAISPEELDEIDDDIPTFAESFLDEEGIDHVLMEKDDTEGLHQVFVPEEMIESDGKVVTVEGEHELLVGGIIANNYELLTDSPDGLAEEDVPAWMSADEFADHLKQVAADAGVEVDSTDGSVSETLADGARHDGDGRFSDRGDRMGGWEEFDPESITIVEELPGGRSVEKVDFEGETAYYAEEASADAARERVGYRAMERLGVKVPVHEFGNSGWSVKREFEGELVNDAPIGWLEGADRDAARDMFAANMIAGNWDMHERNVMVNEHGDVRVIDLDRAGDDMGSEHCGYNDGVGGVGGIRGSSVIIESMGGPERNTAKRQISERTQELSRELLRTGEYDELVADLAEIDERGAKHVAKNVVLFATGANIDR